MNAWCSLALASDSFKETLGIECKVAEGTLSLLCLGQNIAMGGSHSAVAWIKAIVPLGQAVRPLHCHKGREKLIDCTE